MSYSLDLDEIGELSLIAEIERRKSLRNQGLCDYCESNCLRPCKFPLRHGVALAKLRQKLREQDPDEVRGRAT